MNHLKEFLGETVSKVVQALISRGALGVRLHNITAFDPAAMLVHLDKEPRPRVAIAGASVRNLALASNYPSKLLTTDLAQATEWRNDPKVADTVVIVTFGEEERLGSFHRFTEVHDSDLYREICE